MNGQSLRVWLVDDDASIRWVLERALRNGGMAPRAFEAAEPALAARFTSATAWSMSKGFGKYSKAPPS